MNQNYVQKCEEYLENMPPQKETMSSPVPGQERVDPNCVNRKITTSVKGSRATAMASRKLIPVQSSVRGKLPINNRGGAHLPGTVGTEKKTSNVNQQKKQTDSKFVRPCHRPDQQQPPPPERQQRILLDRASRVHVGPTVAGVEARGRANAGDNVNQPDNVKPLLAASVSKLKGNYEIVAAEEQQHQNAKSVTTDSWDGILTSTNAGMSLSQFKSKNQSHHIESSSIGVPQGPPSTLTSKASSSSTSSCSMTRPTSSIVAVSPQPRRPSAAAPQQQQFLRKKAMCKSSELDTDGINLFRFDPLRTLQFLTLELKSKLKALDSSTTGSSPELKQLYKISKEVLLAVKILTEIWNEDQMACRSCKRCDKIAEKPGYEHPLSIDSLHTPTIQCTSCGNLGKALDQQSEIHTQQIRQLNDEINYLKAKLLTQAIDGTKQSTASASREQPQPESCHPNQGAPSTDRQLERWLEGEIKRLQTMISDKQTLQDGLIDDLNRKLQEATSRCRRLEQTRNESEKRLLYATLENERLNFLLNTQASTMTNLRSDFSAIETLAHQQVDLLQDRIQSPPNGTGTSATRPPIGNNKASNPIITIIDNHHCNYRHPSGAVPSSSRTSCSSSSFAVATDDDHRNSDHRNQQPFPSPSSRWQSSNTDSTSTQEKLDACRDDAITLMEAAKAGKLRKQRRHYSFKNNAEKESDDGNDANDLAAQPSPPPFRSMTLSLALEATKALDDDNGVDGSMATFRRKPEDHLMNVPDGGGMDAVGATTKGSKTRPYFNSSPPATLPSSASPETLSSSKSMPSMGFAVIKPVRRTLLIGDELMRTFHADIDYPMATSKKRFPYSAVTTGPAAAKSNVPSLTTNNKHGSSERIGSSKTNNNCACLGCQPEQQQKQQGHLMVSVVAGEPFTSSSPSSKSKKDNDDDNRATIEEKYPRDYGDKFERRESCLPQLSLPPRKELCQNRPIIGQIRQGHSASVGGVQPTNGTKTTKAQLERDVTKVPAVGRNAISVANESASAPQRTEEFSIDFDDITLPTPPTPFQGGSLSSLAGNLGLDDDSSISKTIADFKR